jgi:hypothetical protein
LCTVYLSIKEKEKGINKCMWTATRAIFPYGGGAVSHTALPKSRQPSMDFLQEKLYISDKTTCLT